MLPSQRNRLPGGRGFALVLPFALAVLAACSDDDAAGPSLTPSSSLADNQALVAEVRRLTAGRGITAFAAVIFGRNLPYPVFATAAFFGFSIALTDRLQGLGLPGELVVLIPYFLTVVALAVSSRRTMAAYRQALA